MYKVKDLMNKEIVSVQIDTKFKDILNTFYKYKYHTLPVLKDKKLVGVIKWEDIFQIFKPHPKYIEEFVSKLTFIPREYRDVFNIDLSFEISPEVLVLCVAADLLNTNYLTVTEDESVSKVYKKMKERKVTKAFVVDEEGNLKGILSLLDIILGIFKQKGFI